MGHKTAVTSGTKSIVCPHCKGTLYITANSSPVYCSYCGLQVNAGGLLESTEQKKKLEIEKRKISCFKCGKDILADKNAQALMCKYCYNRNDLSDHKVKNVFGLVLQTYGQLYLLKRGVIETSTIHVGSAVIRGRIVGNISSFGAVEILKNGEVRGDITCRSLIVRKGGIFEGRVHLLNSED